MIFTIRRRVPYTLSRRLWRWSHRIHDDRSHCDSRQAMFWLCDSMLTDQTRAKFETSNLRYVPERLISEDLSSLHSRTVARTSKHTSRFAVSFTVSCSRSLHPKERRTPVRKRKKLLHTVRWFLLFVNKLCPVNSISLYLHRSTCMHVEMFTCKNKVDDLIVKFEWADSSWVDCPVWAAFDGW